MLPRDSLLATANGPYAGRRAILTTMHGKEAAIASTFLHRLALEIHVTHHIDTDVLGTFTGEVPRAGNMVEAALAKARLGMRATNEAIGIASEGAYGPHPQVPWVPVGIELMAFVDDSRGIVVCEQLIDKTPVYDHIVADGATDITEFLSRVRFPEHALIVQPNETAESHPPIFKGLRDRDLLLDAIVNVAEHSKDRRVRVQTDMRAHMNPTRMLLLTRLASALCERLSTPCPACHAPGFGLIDVMEGLPCRWCGDPTPLARHRVFGCVACDQREVRPREDGITHADPANCMGCNP